MRAAMWALGALALTACGGGDGERREDGSANAAAGNAATPAEARVGTLLAEDGSLGRLNRIVAGAGMADLLNGIGPYTVFAPTDDALNGLGDGRADALAGADMRPQAVALLRAHIVPGTVTRRDIDAALARGRPVTMRTMADTMLTFARDGDTIVVTSDRGGRARLSGTERVAANGAVHPVDGALVSAQ